VNRGGFLIGSFGEFLEDFTKVNGSDVISRVFRHDKKSWVFYCIY